MRFMVPVVLEGIKLDEYFKCAEDPSTSLLCQGFLTGEDKDIGIYFKYDRVNTSEAVLGKVKFSDIVNFFNSMKCGLQYLYIRTFLPKFDKLIPIIQYIKKRYKPDFPKFGISDSFIGMSLMGIIGLQYSPYCKRVINYYKDIVHWNKKVSVSVNPYHLSANISNVNGIWNNNYSGNFEGGANDFYLKDILNGVVSPDEYLMKIKTVLNLEQSFEMALLMFADLLLGSISGYAYDYGEGVEKGIRSRVKVFGGTYTFGAEIFSLNKNRLMKWYVYGVTDGKGNYWLTTNIPSTFYLNIDKVELYKEYFFLPLITRDNKFVVVTDDIEFSKMSVDDWVELVIDTLNNDEYDVYNRVNSPVFKSILSVQRSLFLNNFIFNRKSINFVDRNTFFDSVLKSAVQNLL